jgi:hypothetical protein
MASIAGTNALYAAYRNSVVGKTSDYSTRVDCDTDVLYAFFSDDGTVTPDGTHVFHSTYTTAENPAYAACTANPGSRLTSVTAGTVGTGVVDAADYTFTSSTALTGSTSVESYIIAKFITNAAASPVLAHFGNGVTTGLPLTPNGADVTVVYNSSGVWTF